MAADDPALQVSLDGNGNYLAAEVVFSIREEFATTLTDIVFRRMMIGLDADQGRSLYDAVASAAAAEFGWEAAQQKREFQLLVDYADSLRVT